MRIVNAMFSRGSGGIEQCAIDYCEALQLKGHKVSALLYPHSPIYKQLIGRKGLNILGVKNLGQYDIFAWLYIKKVLEQAKADCVIAHGNRAVSLLKWPCKKLGIPLVGVSHNYSIKRLIGLDAVLTITRDLQKTVIAAGQPEEKTFLMPNMIRLPDTEPLLFNTYRSPSVIGTMGRFVKKKGMAEFLHALSHLKKKDIPFKAIIGGNGEEESKLKTLCRELALETDVEFIGWVKDKQAFFEQIDIFCLPSLHEPFGIILLEAFAAKKPMISFDSEGPKEIATHGHDALLAKCGDSKALAEQLTQLLASEKQAKELATNAFDTVKQYDIHQAAERLESYLKEIVVRKR